MSKPDIAGQEDSGLQLIFVAGFRIGISELGIYFRLELSAGQYACYARPASGCALARGATHSGRRFRPLSTKTYA